MEIPTGILADKLGRKISIIIALALQFLGELFFIFADSYLYFVVVCIIGGTGFAFLSGSFEAMMYDSLKAAGQEKEMQKVSGLNGSYALAATMIGSVAGGFITADLQLTHFVQAIIITAVFVFLSFLAGFFLVEPQTVSRNPEDSPVMLVKDGINLIKKNKSLQRILLLSLLTTPFINYLLNFYPPYFVQAKVSGYLFGIALAAASLLGVFTSRYAYLCEKILGVYKGVFLAVILPGIFYFMLAGIYHSFISAILVILAYGSMQIQKPIFSDYLNRHIQSTNRATVLSLINILSGIYVALTGLLIGYIADQSLSYAFIFMAGLITFSAFLIRIDKNQAEAIADIKS
jgi:MFS family permease